MKNEFTIGEISRLHHIPIKTLRYYDSVDLFKPAMKNVDNKYRYYSIEQFEMLNSIKFLRHLGYSINDIKQHLKIKNPESFILSLKEYRKAADEEIKRLENIKGFLSERILELEHLLTDQTLDTVWIKEFPIRHIIYLKEKIRNIFDLELNLRKLENDSGMTPSIMIGRVGLTISHENLKNQKFNEYDSIFILNPNPPLSDSHYAGILEPGLYAGVTFNSGHHDNSGSCYEKILLEIKKQKFKILGDAIERVIIDDFITTDKKMHITEIQIPIIP
ncbi:MAG: MerR family transcriptional regulator [Desulfobacula sp.]|jgi:DNA-binding transcriptional MerR regulator